MRLCAVMHIFYGSVVGDERSQTVAGVKNYPLWEPECQPWSIVYSHTP